MCEPMTLAAASFALSSTKDIMGYLGQKAAYATNKAAANLGYAQTINTLNERQSEIDAQDSEHVVDAVIAQAQAAGRISASASAFGTDAQTAQVMQQSASGQIGRNLAIQRANTDAQRAQVRADSRGADLQRQNQIRSVSKANLAATLVDIGKNAISATSSYAAMGGQLPGTQASSRVVGGRELLHSAG